MLNVEASKGTFEAARLANLDLPGTKYMLSEFNSDDPSYRPLQTAYGPLDIDWFSVLKASSVNGKVGIAAFQYVPEKILSIVKRSYAGEKVTNYMPYAKKDEKNAAFQATKFWVGYKDLLPPDWMAKNCPNNPNPAGGAW